MHHGGQQGPLGQAGVGRSPLGTAPLPLDQPGDDPDGGQVGGAPAADGESQVDRAVTMPLLLVTQAESGADQQIVDGSVGTGVAGRPGQHGTVDQPGVRLGGHLAALSPACAGGGWGEVVDEHVGVGQQPVELRPALFGPEVEHHAPLAAVPREEGRRSRVGSPSGPSTLTTSAPASARSSEATAPAIPSEQSTTRTPSRILGALPSSWSEPCGVSLDSGVRNCDPPFWCGGQSGTRVVERAMYERTVCLSVGSPGRRDAPGPGVGNFSADIKIGGTAMEDRTTPVLYLEMTDRPAERYARRTCARSARPPRSSAGDMVGQLRAVPHRPSPDHAGVLHPGRLRGDRGFRGSRYVPEDIAGYCFDHYPRPGQGTISDKPTLGLELVLISAPTAAQSQALRDWGDFVHIRDIAAAAPEHFTMITPYENRGKGSPRYMHFYELDTDDPEPAFRNMAPATMARVGAYGTHPKEEWWVHEALVIDYVNTFRRLGVRADQPEQALAGGLLGGPCGGCLARSPCSCENRRWCRAIGTATRGFRWMSMT